MGTRSGILWLLIELNPVKTSKNCKKQPFSRWVQGGNEMELVRDRGLSQFCREVFRLKKIIYRLRRRIRSARVITAGN